MTFKEAVQHVYAGTHDQRAIDTLKWYENNVLELEDYETDQLYKVLEKINKLEEFKMTNIEQVLNSEKSLEMAEVVSRSIKTIALQNHIINFASSPKAEMSSDDILVNYTYLTRALSDIFDANQSLMSDLDNAAVYLHDVAEEQQEKEEKPSA